MFFRCDLDTSHVLGVAKELSQTFDLFLKPFVDIVLPKSDSIVFSACDTELATDIKAEDNVCVAFVKLYLSRLQIQQF